MSAIELPYRLTTIELTGDDKVSLVFVPEGADLTRLREPGAYREAISTTTTLDNARNFQIGEVYDLGFTVKAKA